MNFNDLSTRLDRLYLSIGETRNSNIVDSFNVVHRKEKNGYSSSFSFDKGFNENNALNKILLIIHNIANLKDHLKNIFKSKGLNEKIIEDEIDKSLSIKIIIDLSNQEKHGYPLTKTRRSEKDPKIINIYQGVGISKDNNTGIITFSLGGELEYENIDLIISADIVDYNDEYLVGFDELVNSGIEFYELLIKKYL